MGQNYDSNGNQTSGPVGGITYSYDAENRIASVNGAAVQYAYDSQNKRIWKSVLTAGNLAQEVYFYGADGQKIGTYTFTLSMFTQCAGDGRRQQYDARDLLWQQTSRNLRPAGQRQVRSTKRRSTYRSTLTAKIAAQSSRTMP